MCTVYLLRHGKTAMDTLKRSDGWLDLPLTDKGRMGLIEAQQYLKLEPLMAIYAPPLRRTQETAHIVQSGMVKQPDVRTAPEAVTWGLGVLTGTPKVESKPKVKRLIAKPDTKPLGGESYNEFKQRFLPWFLEKARDAKEAGRPILIVCSGSSMRLLGTSMFGDQDAFNLDEGGLVALHYADGSWDKEIIFGDRDASKYES